MGLVSNSITGKVEYLIDLEGGGGAKQSTLLSITTAPSGSFAKGSQYYNSTNRVIYTAVDDNTWTGATTSTPEFGVIYIYSNNGTTTYYQWDGDNLVETDLEKYQLIANKTDDYTDSSKSKYPSSYALHKGLESVRPSAVTNSGATLPTTTGYSLGDTFLNTTDKKLYTTRADNYELNGAFLFKGHVGGSVDPTDVTIDYSTGIMTNANLWVSSGGWGTWYFWRGICKTVSSYRWQGNKEYKFHFLLNSVPIDNKMYNIVYMDFPVSSGYFTVYTVINIGIYNKKLYIASSNIGGYGATDIVDKVLLCDFEFEGNKEYYITINKTNDAINTSIGLYSYSNVVAENSIPLIVQDVNNFNDNTNIHYGGHLVNSSYASNNYSVLGDGFSIGQIYLLDSTGDFLKASGTLIWDNGESLIDNTQYADTTNGIMYFYANNQLFYNQQAVGTYLTFTNVSASSWVSDSTYTDYGYKCELSCNGVTANDFAQVIFAPTEADSGNYATVCQTGSGTVTIYSKVNDTITIPSIVVMGV